jgi:hypothetical protein
MGNSEQLSQKREPLTPASANINIHEKKKDP